jgi:hypothetical protein
MIKLPDAAGAYKRGSRIVIYSSLLTTTGTRITGKVFNAGEDSRPSEIGDLILESLNLSNTPPVERPTREELDLILKPVLDGLGVKSFSALAASSQRVIILRDNPEIVLFRPTRNGNGKQKGFYALTERDKLQSSKDPEGLAFALFRAFELCE